MPTDNGPKRDVKPSPNHFDKKDKGESFNEAAHPWNNPGKTGGACEEDYQTSPAYGEDED